MNKNPDLAHHLTDKELAALEQRIAAEYQKAADELTDKINAYFERFKERDAAQKKLIGTIVNGREYTEQDYKQWRMAQIGRGKRFEDLRDRVAERMTKSNEVAAAYINDTTPGLYSLNRNYAAYTIEQQVGADVGFDLWDEQAVRRLIMKQPDLMPYYPPKRAVKRGIDLAWGKRQITAQVTSGILQGESIKHLADRLQTNIPNMNRNSAIRAARTAVTGAQNAGRIDSYFRAEEMGIRLKKRWLSTLDGRTRHAHQLLDGQVQPNKKPFQSILGDIMFPGDPNAAPSNVYNCRCTLIAEVEGVDMSDALRRDRWGPLPNMTYAQWENTKRGEGALLSEKIEKEEDEREERDWKQYKEYKAILGKNAPKSFAKFQDLKYNSGEWEAFKSYKRAIQTGELTALADFTLYQETSREIDEKLVGLTTSNGIKITGKSIHFISRVIGSIEQRRSGVDIKTVSEALTDPNAIVYPVKTYRDGSTSQKFRYSGVEVSVNPYTGNLIQTNPKI